MKYLDLHVGNESPKLKVTCQRLDWCMLKKHWFWIAVCIIAILAVWFGARYYTMYRLSPKINPHPKYFVTITGNVEPHMPYPETLIFRATYAAYKPNCHIWVSWLAGVRGMRGHPVYYPIHPNSKGDYVVKIPIDAYKAGRCDWKMAWVEYSMMHKLPSQKQWPNAIAFGDLIRFAHIDNSDGIPGYPVQMKNTAYCGKGLDVDNCHGDVLAGGYANFSVLRTQSYHFIQNIKKQERL